MRRFTASAADRIYVGTAGLGTFDWRWGTIALVVNMVTTTAAATYVATNNTTGASVDFWHDATVLSWYDGSTARSFPGLNPPSGVTCVIGVSKPAGTVVARGHVFNSSTGVWTHTDSGGTIPDAAVTSSVGIGSYADAAASDPLDAEVGAVAMWPSWSMSDHEFERLAKGNWASRSPGFCVEFFTAQDSVGDLPRNMGRSHAVQTSRSGTTLGVAARPPGFRPSTQARRR